MDKEKKVVSLSDRRREIETQKDGGVIANPNVDPEVLQEFNNSFQDQDFESLLRVFRLLQTISEKTTISIDQSSISITSENNVKGWIDCGVDFPKQVIKISSERQKATISFEKEDEWSEDDFIGVTTTPFQRLLESLLYWASGKTEDK